MKKIKIGITGSAGSGKSIVGETFRKKGAAVLDSDQIARQVVEPGKKGLEELVKRYGRNILSSNGGLNRARLRDILIHHPGAKADIEAILHPLIRDEMNDQIESAFEKDGRAIVAVEVPLLFESGMDALFDITVAVIANEKTLINRIKERDSVNEQDAENLLKLQMSQEDKARRADFTIENDGSLSQLVDMVDKLFDKIQKEFLTI